MRYIALLLSAVGSNKYMLMALFYVIFPVVFECATVYSLSIASGHSAFALSVAKSIIYCILFVAVRNIRICTFCYIVLVYIPSLMNILHMLILKAEINAYSIYLAFVSPQEETSEFIRNFLDSRIVLISAIYIVTGILFSIFIKKNYKNISITVSRKMRICMICFFSIVYTCIAFGNENYSNPIDKIVRAIYEYNRDKVRSAHILAGRNSIDYGSIISKFTTDKPQTYVIVFGESVDRKHMSLYGYHRGTTPYFNSIKNNLIVFNNVSSAYASTILALKWSLAFNGDLYNGDLISFLNAAGFKTYWISNQYVIEKDDGIFSILARLVNGFFIFKNAAHQRGSRSSTYDECLIPYIEKALSDTHSKKVIFVHLLGSHHEYKSRYPSEFDIFSEKGMSARALRVAYYDNSILYTDYVLQSIIENLQKRTGEIVGMIYYSDHGEDCYDNPYSIHTHCEGSSCPHMYDIPMIVWANSEYLKLRDLRKYNTNIKYSTKEMIHSLLDFFGLENKHIDQKKSLFYEKVD